MVVEEEEEGTLEKAALFGFALSLYVCVRADQDGCDTAVHN